MKKTLVACVVLAVAGGCNADIICGCSPARPSHIFYGSAPGAGTADAWQSMRVELGAPSVCDAFTGITSQTYSVPANGVFRQIVVGFSGGDVCARVTFFELSAPGSDSLVLSPTLVTFARRMEFVDSTHVVLPP